MFCLKGPRDVFTRDIFGKFEIIVSLAGFHAPGAPDGIFPNPFLLSLISHSLERQSFLDRATGIYLSITFKHHHKPLYLL